MFFNSYRLLQNCHDDNSKFMNLLAKPGCSYLEQEDFIPLLQVRTPVIATTGHCDYFLIGIVWLKGQRNVETHQCALLISWITVDYSCRRIQYMYVTSVPVRSVEGVCNWQAHSCINSKGWRKLGSWLFNPLSKAQWLSQSTKRRGSLGTVLLNPSNAITIADCAIKTVLGPIKAP